MIKLDLASLQLLLQGQYVLTSVEIILIQDSNITVYMDVSDSTTTCEPFGHRGIQQSLILLRTCFFHPVPEAACPASFRCFPAPTQPIQMACYQASAELDDEQD